MNHSRSWSRSVAFTGLVSLISLVTSALTVMLVPKVSGIGAFAHWQLYTFYLGYASLLHFGWADGVFLRRGGEVVGEYDRSLFSGELLALVSVQIVLALIVSSAGLALTQDADRQWVWVAVAFALVPTNLRAYLVSVMQAQGRFEVVASFNLATLMGTVASILVAVTFFQGDFLSLVFGDSVVRTVVCLATLVTMRAEFGRPRMPSVVQIMLDVRSGLFVVMAYLAGIGALGLVRLASKISWGLNNFAMISLLVALIRLVTAFAIPLGPFVTRLFKRADPIRHAALLRDGFMLGRLAMSVALVSYFPLAEFLPKFLPEFDSAFRFLPFVMGAAYFEGLTGLILAPLLKAFRSERFLWTSNMAALAASAAGLGVAMLLHSQQMLVLVILLIPLVRINMLQRHTSELVQLPMSSLLDLLSVGSFLLIAYFFSPAFGGAIWIVMTLALVLAHRGSLRLFLVNLRAKEAC